MPTTLFFDECGFTGEDLAQVDQPVFVVASHDIEDEEARAMKDRHFGHVRAEELKHSSLQRRPQPQAAVASVLEAVLGADRARVSLAHKPFALIAKIVDLLIEPLMHRDGIDLYESGGNDALANVLYYSLGAHSQHLLLEVVNKFQRAVRTRRPECVNECNQLLLSDEVSAALDGLPPIFPVTLARGGRDWAEDLAERSLDLSLPLSLQQCWAWRNRGPGPFNIVHDRSSAMAKSKWLGDAIVAPDAPEALVGRGWFTVQYPLTCDTCRTSLLPSRRGARTRALLESGAASRVAPNILSIAHLERLLGAELYAPLSRLDRATLLRRTFDVDVKHCAACGGRMTVRAVVTDAAAIARLLAALRRSRDPPAAA
jgi:hypothetical protein